MERVELDVRANALRKELKAWEKTFAAENDGRKAGRDDIKANLSISAKYKEYNKLREVLSGKAAPQTPSKRAATRQPTHDVQRSTKPQSKSQSATPLKRKYDSGVDMSSEADVPNENENLSPQGPEMIGPTPQRDGIVIGLFDILEAETPSKRRCIMAEVSGNALQTPSKKRAVMEEETPFKVRCERTPQSEGKRFLLDKFVTPQKRKRGESSTPSSSLKEFATPSFLRRDAPLEVIFEDEEPTPRPAPWKRRGLGRSLSSMIQALKKQEEDRLDEEAEIMREMEMEEQGIVQPKKPKPSHVIVEDSQAAPMPLGPDRGVESEGEEEELPSDALDRNGNPRKVWKKKGLKRQTRRVIMRPNFVKPLPPSIAQEQEGESEKEEAVPDTQAFPAMHDDIPDFHDDDDSDYASDESHTPKKRRTESAPKPAANSQIGDKASRSVGAVVAKAARKIKATAHANYCKLKIKSSKGNAGGRRFGRRR